MTELLQQTIDRLTRLPSDQQDWVAQWILEELESEARWDALFAKSQDVLAMLADEALADLREGRTELLDPETL